MSVSISCPKCSQLLTINTEEFLKGTIFSCTSCHQQIGINQPTDLAQEKLKAFKEFARNKKEPSSQFPCPDCRTQIPFNPKDLIKGKEIQCPVCKVSISLTS